MKQQLAIGQHITDEIGDQALTLFREKISNRIRIALSSIMTKHRMYAHIERSCNVPITNELEILTDNPKRQSWNTY